MAGKRSQTKEARKLPSQRRSMETVASILKATEMIIVDQGVDSITTNRIAELSGVGIGSIYQYFPNKESILARLIDDYSGYVIIAFREAAKPAEGDTLSDYITRIIEASVAQFRRAPQLYRILKSLVIPLGKEPAIEALMAEATKTLVENLKRLSMGNDAKGFELRLYILVKSVKILISETLDAQSEWDAQKIGRELSEFAMLYLSGKVAMPPNIFDTTSRGSMERTS